MFLRVFCLCLSLTAAMAEPIGFEPNLRAHFNFEGFVGHRIDANARNWLVPAPAANPGMIAMFQARDRLPKPNLVPWAGEFAGKYLISAIPTLRMGSHANLKPVVEEVVRQLIASQAEDGYLGPFPKAERLRGHWDLWGHYHCMLALLMWHEQTGDQAALNCAKRAADLVCATYLDTGRRAIDAGSDEMNLSIIHALGWLYRVTREDRYFRMMREIEKDWERGGDYLRAGLNGVEFFQSPRPRWESLHNIQGLVELYRITGEEKYKRAFEQHWRSIARWDLRNSGGFSSGEQATGNPYSNTAIETCCSIAWMVLSIDMLKLTGDARVADLLELATFNAWAGAQHPSGRWCTYSTPMDGAREASAHSIVFQSRPGTPELNCCSVNGPRGWSMLTDWAAIKMKDGYLLNWLAPGTITFPQTDSEPSSQPVTFRIEGNYPVDNHVTIRLKLRRDEEFTVRIRVPEWSTRTVAKLNGETLPTPQAGSYLNLRRKWRGQSTESNVVSIQLDMAPRAVAGAREARGKVSIYRGPLLLAWDQRFNSYDESDIPDLKQDDLSRLALLPRSGNDISDRALHPLLLLELSSANGKTVRLCDFASAGASGTRYRSWLPATNSPPPPTVARFPRDGAKLARGQIAFRWTGQIASTNTTHRLEFSESDRFTNSVHDLAPLDGRETLVQIDERFHSDRTYYWRVVSSNRFGETVSTAPHSRFQLDPNLPLARETLTFPRALGPNGELVRASFKSTAAPEFGEWLNRSALPPVAAEFISLNGQDQRLLYAVGDWPEENYSVTLRFRIKEFPAARMGQLFSAWTAPSDDPLRLTVQDGKLFARIEAGSSYSTAGVPIEKDRWYRLAAIKRGSRLQLYLDGTERGSCTVPEYISSRARDFALGGNPHYTGKEFIAADFAEVSFYPDAIQP